MVAPKPAEGLPSGWTVEVREGKHGRKYKVYSDPKTGRKFKSIPEVSRYLRANRPKTKKKKNRRHVIEEKVEGEKVVLKDLLPGWIKEVKVRKYSHTIKRDPYYTDPVSGWVFRSLKSALHFLKTGEIGKLAFKPKDGSSSSLAVTDDKISSPVVVKRQKLAETETRTQDLEDQKSNSRDMVKVEQIVDLADTKERRCPVKNISDQGMECSEMSCSKVHQGSILGQIEGAGNPATPASLGQSPENGLKSENRKTTLSLRKTRDKKSKLPQRASRRLAGQEAEPTLVLPTIHKPRRGQGQYEETMAERSATVGMASGTTSPLDHLEAMPDVPGITHGATQTEMLLEPKKLKTSSEEFGTSENPAAATSDKLKTSSEYLGASENSTAALETPDKLKTASVELDPPENLPAAIPLPFGDSWSDPCIEFAIKTLTGAIPVEDELSVQDYLQPQPSSSQTLGDSTFTFPNIGTDNFYQTDVLFPQLDTMDKQGCKQQALAKPSLQHPGDAHLWNAGENVVNQPGEERRNECQRRGNT
ncbi:Methyl-CpG DNA binding [Dillenia turbinata]|uniref:Methyl-CpG DNA binding n=1 Tax=Dillenia turbinata TaxID=194707 RepID=A0AAN8ZG41_9MAGN